MLPNIPREVSRRTFSHSFQQYQPFIISSLCPLRFHRFPSQKATPRPPSGVQT